MTERCITCRAELTRDNANESQLTGKRASRRYAQRCRRCELERENRRPENQGIAKKWLTRGKRTSNEGRSSITSCGGDGLHVYL